MSKLFRWKATVLSLSRRAAVLALPVALLAGMGVAKAEEPRRIAVLTLLGNKLTAVTQQSRTGTRLSQNIVDDLDLPAGLLDSVATSAVVDVLAKADASALFAPLKLASATELGDPDKLFSGGKFQVPAALAPTLKQLQVTHMVVVTPYRARAVVKGWRDGIGSGHLEGLGFYVDRELRVQNMDTGQQMVGYMAPFTYYKVWFVDLVAGTVTGSAPVTHAQMLMNRNLQGAGDPWDSFSTKEKMELLDQQMREDLGKVLPPLAAKT